MICNSCRDRQNVGMAWRRTAVVYLSVQGLAAALWWLAIWHDPAGPLTLIDVPMWLFQSLAAADVFLFVLGSFIAAAAVARNWKSGYVLLCIQCGVTLYAGLLTYGLAAFGGTGWLGAIMMSPGMLILPLLVWKLSPRG